MFNLPDLSGQPAWVVIVVFSLFTVGTLGIAWMRRGSRLLPGGEGDAEELDGARPNAIDGVSSPSVAHDVHAAQLVKQALDQLAAEASESREARAETAFARREAEQARREAEQMRRDLNACIEERQRLSAALERCDAECARLARRALGRGEGDGR